MAQISVFTKDIVEKEYGFGLACSVHFDLCMDDGTKLHMNNGCGILYPVAMIAEDNTIQERGVLNPTIIREESTYIISCKYIDSSLQECLCDREYVWKTKDFIDFEDCGLCEKTFSKSEANDLTKVDIDADLIPSICERWCPVPENGTENNKRADELGYPLIKGFADPVFFSWENSWYMLATNDINGNIGLFLRKAPTLEGLFSEDAKVSVILDYSKEHEFIQTFWAPEWHIVGGVPYIFFAVGGTEWAPQSHIMKYRGEGDICNPDSWELPVRVKGRDGRFLCENGITLDMTYFKSGDTSYVVWSERYHIGSKLDSGSMLYIATVDEKNPAVLTSDKVLLSRPLFGWENVDGTINNEGPYALKNNGVIYLSYSGGAAVGHTYAVGYLMAKEGEDLLDTSNWSKYPTAALSAYSIAGIDGPGHCSFFKDDNGNTMIAYHCQLEMRTSTFHKVHFDKTGFPMLSIR